MLYLFRSVGVEENLLQQVIILAEHSAGNVHVAFERSSRCVLVFHDCREDESADERNAQRVGYRLVVLLESVLVYAQSESLVKVLEEDSAHVVALAYHDGVLLAQLVEVRKGGAEHRVSGHVAVSALGVKLLQAGLYRRNVAYNAVFGQVGHYLPERRYRVFYGYGVDNQLGFEVLNLFQRRETQGVESKPQPLGILLVHSRLVLEAE